MMLLVIDKPITDLLKLGLVRGVWENIPEILENVSDAIEDVGQALPTQKRLVAQWVKDEAGKLVCRWSKE